MSERKKLFLLLLVGSPEELYYEHFFVLRNCGTLLLVLDTYPAGLVAEQNGAFGGNLAGFADGKD